MKIAVILEEEKYKETWNRLSNYFEIDYYTDYDNLDFKYLFSEYDAIFGLWVEKSIFTEENCKNAKVKYIATLGHGYEKLDNNFGIAISNTIYGTNTVAEHELALLMQICRHIPESMSCITKNNWEQPVIKQFELYGKTCGIIGYGNIGKQFGKIVEALGMKVQYLTNHSECIIFSRKELLENIVEQSDVVAINVSGNDCIFTDEILGKMKQNSILLNISRGSVIDENALLKYLKMGKFFGVGLDVLQNEPQDKNNSLFNFPNVYITPHIAYQTDESRIRAINLAINNFYDYLKGDESHLI